LFVLAIVEAVGHPGHSRFALIALVLSTACSRPLASNDHGSETETGATDPSTTSETATETETETGMSELFAPKYDGLPEPCDNFMQDCPDGEKCVAYSSDGGYWDSTKCVPVLGDQAAGEPCTYDGIVEATDNCDATTFCWYVTEVDGELVGTCATLCAGSPDEPECPPGSSCPIGSNSSLALCIEACDPLAQDCNPGLACYWAYADFNCMFTTQDLPVGEPCGFTNACAGGSACIDANLLPDCAGSACCSPFCSLGGGDTQCEGLPGTSCLPFFEEAPPGYEQIGICIAP
jgi:hypothetical protein